MWPARYCLKTSDSPSKALRESFHRLEWTWHDEPIQAWFGLAMNVTEQPRWCAISLIPFLYTTWLSAMVSASAKRKLISC